VSTAVDKTGKQGSRDRELAAAAAGADRGDSKALAKLHELFDATPSLWDSVGDLAFQAEYSMLEVMAGQNTVVREAVSRKLRKMRKELAGPTPSPLEALLAERIAACWLHLQHAESIYAQAFKQGSIPLAVGDYHQRRLSRAQRRYVEAIRTLAQVRRLLTPVVQVNIAEQQVNLAAVASVPESACSPNHA
jgi:hypothetical protein